MIRGRASLGVAILALVPCIALPPASVWAEEAAAGHYIPGATSSFIDMLPDRDTSSLIYANAFTYYDGNAGAGKILDFGGLLTADAHGELYADTSLLLYQVPWKVLGGQPAFEILVPYVWLKVNGEVALSGRKFSPKFQREDTANGFGDLEFFPAMMGWKAGDFKWQGQFGIYAPSGSFKKSDLANIGRNYWTFEPSAGASYLSTSFGLEVTAFAGFDFNTKNDTTEYQTGDQFHLDGTIAEHLPLPLLGGFIGAGVNGYFYQQISGDSGTGAKLGSFEGMTTGIGPIVSYAYQLGDFDIAGEAKWLPELGVDNRLNGNTIWVKLGVSWGPKPEGPIKAL